MLFFHGTRELDVDDIKQQQQLACRERNTLTSLSPLHTRINSTSGDWSGTVVKVPQTTMRVRFVFQQFMNSDDTEICF